MRNPLAKVMFLIRSLKNTMIIIKTLKKIKLSELDDEKYHEIIDSLDLSSLGNDTYTVHAYYKRNIIVYGETIIIYVLRVRSKTTGKTHAVILECMLPFFRFCCDDIIAVVKNEDRSVTSSSNYYRIRKTFASLLSFSYDEVCSFIASARNIPLIFLTATT